MRNVSKMSYECTITGRSVESITSKEENYEYALNPEEFEFIKASYPQWFQDILDAPYEIIIKCRKHFLDHDMDERWLKVLDYAAYSSYRTLHKDELAVGGDDLDEGIYDLASNYVFDNYYYNVWLQEQSDEVVAEEEFSLAAA